MSGVEATTRVVAGLWVLVLAVVAFPVSPFLAAGVIGGAVSALIEHAYRG